MRISIKVGQYHGDTGKTTTCDTDQWQVCNGFDEGSHWNFEARWGNYPNQSLRIYAASEQDQNDGSRGGEIRTYWREARISIAPDEIPKLIDGLVHAGYLSSEITSALEEARDKIDSALKKLKPAEADGK